MKQTLFPTLEEAIELHKVLLKRFGGSGGVRDLGLLQSALARPQSGYYETLSLQAAALMHSLAMNHCFVDGNKRVAIALTIIFLRINSQKFSVTPDEGEKFLVEEVIKSKVDIDIIREWIEAHITLG